MAIQKRNADLSIAWENYYSEFFINTNSGGEWDHIFYRAMLIDSGNHFLVHYELEPAGGEAGLRGEYIKIFDAGTGKLVKTIRPEGKTFYWQPEVSGEVLYTDIETTSHPTGRRDRVRSCELSTKPPFTVNRQTRAVFRHWRISAYSLDSSLIVWREINNAPDSVYDLKSTLPLTYEQRGAKELSQWSTTLMTVDFQESTFSYYHPIYETLPPYRVLETTLGVFDIKNSFIHNSVSIRVKSNARVTEHFFIATEEKLVRHSSDSNIAYREVFDFHGNLLEEDSLLNFFEQKFYYSLQVDSLVIWVGEKGGNAYLVAKERDGVTGLNTQQSHDYLRIYPNPAENQVKIAGDFNGNLSIYNSEGRLVWEGDYYGNEMIDCSHWSAGLYFIVLNGESRKQTAKFVIQ